MQLYDTHSTKKAGGTLSTVLGIIGAIIVLALLWQAYTAARDKQANTEAIAAGSIGNLTSAVGSVQEELRTVVRHERADAIKLAYTDGVLFGRPSHYGPHGFGEWDGCGHGHGHGYGRRDDDCGQKQQFREIRTFAETADNIEVINTCGPRV